MPDPVPYLAALLPRDPAPYVLLMLAGFAAGILGHLSRTRWLVVAGIVLVALGAFLLPLALNLTQSAPPSVKSPG